MCQAELAVRRSFGEETADVTAVSSMTPRRGSLLDGDDAVVTAPSGDGKRAIGPRGRWYSSGEIERRHASIMQRW